MKKLFFLMLFIPIIGNTQTSEVCECADISLSMAKEVLFAKMDMEKMNTIQEKYKARMAKCDKLGEGKSDEEQKRMREEMEKCPSYKELEKIHKEMMGELDKESRIDSFYREGFYKYDYKSAIMDFTNAINLRPNFVEAYCYRGFAKFMKDDNMGAMADFNTALLHISSNQESKYDEVTILSDNIAAEIYLNRGRLKNKLKDYRGAILDLNLAFGLNDSFVNDAALFERGLAKSYLKDFMGANLDFTKVIQMKTATEQTAYLNRGLNKIYLLDFDGACLDFSKAGELGNVQAYEHIRKYCN